MTLPSCHGHTLHLIIICNKQNFNKNAIPEYVTSNVVAMSAGDSDTQRVLETVTQRVRETEQWLILQYLDQP